MFSTIKYVLNIYRLRRRVDKLSISKEFLSNEEKLLDSDFNEFGIIRKIIKVNFIGLKFQKLVINRSKGVDLFIYFLRKYPSSTLIIYL